VPGIVRGALLTASAIELVPLPVAIMILPIASGPAARPSRTTVDAMAPRAPVPATVRLGRMLD
jgi:hypothetical protein